MQGPYSEIEGVLQGARRRRAWVVLATTLGWGGAGVAAALLGGAVGLSLRPQAAWLARPTVLLLALVGGLVAVAWGVRALWRSAWAPRQVAATVAADDPSLRSALWSALELVEERESLEGRGLSGSLADEHVVRTGRRAREIDLRVAIPDRSARRAGWGLVAVVAAWALASALLGRGLWDGWARLAHGPPESALAPRVEPVTGDVEITYRYPAHTGRAERKVPGSDGSLQAPRGTEVLLSTRSDRPVRGAQLAIEGPDPKDRRVVSLSVKNGRELSGSFPILEAGSYRFQFTEGSRVVVNGPPIPIVVEPDAFPEVVITVPVGEVEVDADARVHVEWSASDDHGLGDLALVTKTSGGEEARRVLRSLAPARRDSGSFELELAPLRLSEGERLLYWLEVVDNDTVSGPKRAASATRTVKIYSPAEHHRRVLAEARRHWEEMVTLLGDRLEQLSRGHLPETGQVQKGLVLDGRTRQLHERLREAARALRGEKAAPRALPAALANVAQGIRDREAPLTAARQTLSRQMQFGRPGEAAAASRAVDGLDDALDRELEKDVLYLEQLFDKQRAEDLVRMAKDLAARRRDLASLLEKYRQAPTEEAKRELLAEASRLRTRMQDVLRQMAELAKGVSDGHMNAEAMAEMARGKDVAGGMKKVEEMLAQDDVDAALKELDAMGSRLQEMTASLERTAGMPDERTAGLSRQLRELQEELRDVEQEQEKVAQETEKVRREHRKEGEERLKRAEPVLRKVEELARKAESELRGARAGNSPRSEDDHTQARERMDDLRKALASRDVESALEASRRAAPPLQRLAGGLEDEAAMAERFPQGQRRDPSELRESAKHAREALPPLQAAREELEKLLPQARTPLPQGGQGKLDALAKQQQGLEQKAGKLQQKLDQMSQEAPVFPSQAGRDLAEGRGHMEAATGALSQGNPQRGAGQQREALGALERFRKGLEQMGKGGRSGGGAGFPMPFASDEHGPEGGDDPSREKVEIPATDPSKVREQFRRDLLEAMKQGTPEPYQVEVKRYYEELVK